LLSSTIFSLLTLLYSLFAMFYLCTAIWDLFEYLLILGAF